MDKHRTSVSSDSLFERNNLKNFILIILATVAILIIVTVTFSVFERSQQEITDEHDDHLIDIANTVDTGLTNLLTDYRQTLSALVSSKEFRLHEDNWIDNGYASGIREAISNNLLTSTGAAANIVVYRNGTVELDDSGNVYSFPYFNYLDRLGICMDNHGKTFFVLFEPSVNHDFEYAALIDLNVLYERVVPNKLRDNYRIFFYDTSYELLLENEEGSSKLTLVNAYDIYHTDGYRVMVKSEISDTYLLETYTTPKGTLERIASVPVTKTTNKTFTVAVSTNYMKTYGTMRNMTAKLVLCLFILTITIIFFVTMIISNIKENTAAAEELELVKQKNNELGELIKKTEELAHHQRLETIGTMTSSIAHDINNLLIPVMSYSIMVMEKLPETDTENYDHLSDIYEASAKAKTLLHRLSELSRKNSKLELSVVSPDEVVSKGIHMAEPGKPESVFVNTILKVPERCIRVNELQFSQAVLNITINAFHAMAAKGGCFTAITKQDEANVYLIFRDTGSGISNENLEHIFDPFFTTKESGKGTGLGLAIVHKTIEDINGTIDVQSTVGEGTVFTITIPKLSEEEMNNTEPGEEE